jgi:glycolate oxidase FAD binding subunit
MAPLARQLAETIGPEHVSEQPELSAAPGSVEELAAALALAHAAGAVAVPVGGGTRRALGGALRPGGREVLVVRTHRLCRIIQHEPADLTISAEAGITLAALDAHLAAHGQMLPVDAALPARSTLGGALAANADGPRSARYGTWRDLLIGVRVVECTGRVSKAGGMVVKNVSGFDMMKLYTGSLGSLAIIASANFKLLPRPREAATIACACPSPEAVWQIVEAIRRSPLQPTAVELIEDWGLEIRDGEAQIPGALPPNIQHTSSGRQSPIPSLQSPIILAVAAEGHPAAVQRHVRDVGRMAQEAGATSELIAGAGHAALWARIADLPQADALAEGESVLRVATLPAALPAALALTGRLAEQYDLPLTVSARALAGVAYLRLRGPALRPFLGELRAGIAGGGVAVMGARPPLSEPGEVWGEPTAGIALMRRIKAEFDPQNMLNPGRFIV